MANKPRTYRSAQQIAGTEARRKFVAQRSADAVEARKAVGPTWLKARTGYLLHHPICVRCEMNGVTSLSNRIAHTKPINGDWSVFWNSDNWLAVCENHYTPWRGAGAAIEVELEQYAAGRVRDMARGTAASRGYDADWQTARASFLVSFPYCAHCLEGGRQVAASVVDHIVPHRGNRALFWDKTNWQSLCRHCHNSWKQSQEKKMQAW